MITINHCIKCGTNFLIPMEYSDGLDITFFGCPECLSKNWGKLSDSPVLLDKLTRNNSFFNE